MRQLENNLEKKFGLHRVLKPKGVLPQKADILDVESPPNDDEIAIAVSSLNVDSASFHQFLNANSGDTKRTGEAILNVIRARGKLQNPVTGSGGMLIGTIERIGKNIANPDLKKLAVGDRIATLVSLTLTPLKIKEIKSVEISKERINVTGRAILFDSGIAAKIPSDIDEGLALAVLDVCGAPAQTQRLVKPEMNVVVFGGGGKSGILCLYEAKKIIGDSGKVIAFEYSQSNIKKLEKLSFVDEVIQGNATEAVESAIKIKQKLHGEGADLVINVTNVPNTEMASILSAKNRGTVYFFSMATQFAAAALGAEGVAADIDLMIGNGYARGHADCALDILRDSNEIRTLFEQMYEAES